jgi:hypothetical protein
MQVIGPSTLREVCGKKGSRAGFQLLMLKEIGSGNANGKNQRIYALQKKHLSTARYCNQWPALYISLFAVATHWMEGSLLFKALEEVLNSLLAVTEMCTLEGASVVVGRENVEGRFFPTAPAGQEIRKEYLRNTLCLK